MTEKCQICGGERNEPLSVKGEGGTHNWCGENFHNRVSASPLDKFLDPRFFEALLELPCDARVDLAKRLCSGTSEWVGHR